jgi:hypothetical protein
MAADILTTGSLLLFSLGLFFPYNQNCVYVCSVEDMGIRRD